MKGFLGDIGGLGRSEKRNADPKNGPGICRGQKAQNEQGSGRYGSYGPGGARQSGASRFAGAEDPGDHEEQHTRAQGPLKALDGAGGFGRGEELHVELVEDLGDASRGEGAGSELKIGAASSSGEFPENVGIELGLNDIPLIIANVVAARIRIGIRDEAAAFGADADGEDEDLILQGFFDHGRQTGFSISTVAEEDEAVRASRGFFKGLDGQIKGLGQDTATFGDREEIERLDRFGDRIMIGCERCLKVGMPREGNQANAVARKDLKQILCGEGGAGETIRRDVVGEHAPRGVDGDDDVPSAFDALDFLLSPAGLGEREDEEAESRELESKDDPSEDRIGTRHQSLAQSRSGEGIQHTAALRLRSESQQQQQWQCGEQPKVLGVGKVEGFLNHG